MDAQSPPVTCRVVRHHESGEVNFTREEVEKLLGADEFFWLDLDQPDAGDFEILSDVFKFHPLAVEDSEHFGQRAKIDDYDDFVFLVVYGAAPDEDRLVEVHCFYSERFLVTVHRDDCPAFSELRARYAKRDEPVDQPVAPPLPDRRRRSSTASSRSWPTSTTASTSSRTRSSCNADDAQLQEIFAMKRLLVGMRKAVAPQRDTFAALMGGVAELPGLSDEDERYFRDVYDHLIRISDLIDSYRDLLTGAMDVYLSTVSNRLNAVMKQLTIIATIFLPLAWLTGFFGQNFGWMVRHVGSWEAFLVLGVLTEASAVAFMLYMFRRNHWFDAGETAFPPCAPFPSWLATRRPELRPGPSPGLATGRGEPIRRERGPRLRRVVRTSEDCGRVGARVAGARLALRRRGGGRPGRRGRAVEGDRRARRPARPR